MRFAPRAHGAINPEMKSKIREVHLYIAHVEVCYSPIRCATWRRIVSVFVMLRSQRETVHDTGNIDECMLRQRTVRNSRSIQDMR